jgi:hypothetical protein
MADVRTASIILEDVSTQAGVPLHRANQGDAAAGKNALPALVAKDASGNLQYPLVNSLRQLVVSMNGDDVAYLDNNGKVSGSGSFVDVATITLDTAKDYEDMILIFGCTRDAEFIVIHNDDGTPTTLAQGPLTGSGNLSEAFPLTGIRFTSGATGTQQLKVQGKNLNALSDLRATIAVKELQGV